MAQYMQSNCENRNLQASKLTRLFGIGPLPSLSVMKYLETAEELEEYGLWHYIVTREHDPTPVRLSLGTTGFFITVNNRCVGGL